MQVILLQILSRQPDQKRPGGIPKSHGRTLILKRPKIEGKAPRDCREALATPGVLSPFSCAIDGSRCKESRK